MKMRYYRLLADPAANNRWFLDEPLCTTGGKIDARLFTYGEPYSGPRPLNVPILQDGRRVQFNLAAFDMPVVTERIATAFGNLASDDIQRFPVQIGDDISGYEILNIIGTRNCVDEKSSDVIKWESEDDRAEQIGEFRMITNLTIDPVRAEGHHIFRLQGWEIALIVSEDLRNQIEDLESLGILFDSVMP